MAMASTLLHSSDECIFSSEKCNFSYLECIKYTIVNISFRVIILESSAKITNSPLCHSTNLSTNTVLGAVSPISSNSVSADVMTSEPLLMHPR